MKGLTMKKNHHLKHYLAQLEKEFSEMKLRISKSIIKLKEKEHTEGHYCLCKTKCRIFHHKHNWSRPKSLDIFNGLEKIEQEHQSLSRTFPCKLCSDTFADNCDLRVHIEKSHSQVTAETLGTETADVQSTNDVITSEEDGENIINKVSDVGEPDIGAKPKQYSCEMCDTIFVTQGDLENHTRTEHDNRQSPHVLIKNLCDVCLISFDNEAQLKQHISRRHKNAFHFEQFMIFF